MLQPASSANGSVGTTDGNTGKKLSQMPCYQLHWLSIRSSVTQGICGSDSFAGWKNRIIFTWHKLCMLEIWSLCSMLVQQKRLISADSAFWSICRILHFYYILILEWHTWYIPLFITRNCVWSSRQFQKISLNIFGQSLNASYSEHCNEIPTIFLPPLHGGDRLVKKYLGVCNIRLGKSHFSSARLYLISQQPLSLIGMKKCLSECSVIFCTHCNGVSDASHTHRLLPRARIILIITNRTCILFDERICWPKFQTMLCAHGSMRCMFLRRVCRVHSCLCFLVPYVAVSHHLPLQHS